IDDRRLVDQLAEEVRFLLRVQEARRAQVIEHHVGLLHHIPIRHSPLLLTTRVETSVQDACRALLNAGSTLSYIPPPPLRSGTLVELLRARSFVSSLLTRSLRPPRSPRRPSMPSLIFVTAVSSAVSAACLAVSAAAAASASAFCADSFAAFSS